MQQTYSHTLAFIFSWCDYVIDDYDVIMLLRHSALYSLVLISICIIKKVLHSKSEHYSHYTYYVWVFHFRGGNGFQIWTEIANSRYYDKVPFNSGAPIWPTINSGIRKRVRKETGVRTNTKALVEIKKNTFNMPILFKLIAKNGYLFQLLRKNITTFSCSPAPYLSFKRTR